MTAPLLELRNVETFYGPIMAIRGVSLKVDEGEIVAVLGANGAGKTTLLKTACGALDSNKGRVLLEGEEIQCSDPDAVARAFAEFDERWIVVPLVPVLDALPWAGVAGVEMVLRDPMAVDAIRHHLEAAAPDLLLTDWRELNGALFAALRWQTLSLFVVLSLVVAVASFQVSSALVVLAIDKRRTTGMLQALGATPASVRRILVLAGTLLGGVGVVGGVCIGWLASSLMTSLRVIRFPPDLARVYMVDHIPLVVDPVHLLAVISVCMVLVIGASLWPAWKSSRLDPVTALKAV